MVHTSPSTAMLCSITGKIIFRANGIHTAWRINNYVDGGGRTLQLWVMRFQGYHLLASLLNPIRFSLIFITLCFKNSDI